MSISDPIGDMLTRVRNAGKATHTEVTMPASKMKAAIAEVLKSEGYITDYKVINQKGSFSGDLVLTMKYHKGEPVIDGLKRVSKPSCRIYVGNDEIPRVRGGLGIVILSTSSGVMSGRKAQKANIGGELLAMVW